MTRRRSDAPAPLVILWAPIRCPSCGSRRRTDVGRKSGDRVSYHRCRDCDQRFKAIALEAQEVEARLGGHGGEVSR